VHGLELFEALYDLRLALVGFQDLGRGEGMVSSKFRDGDGCTGGLSEASAQKTLTTLPSTWTSGPQELEGPLSAYGAAYP
jgi:hypothetical protein